MSRSPPHNGAEAGHVSLSEFLLKITNNKNPKLINGDIGWTPLHEAAQYGHLLICYMMIKEIKDKNPEDVTGYTPLHVAAGFDQLETFK